VDPATGDIVDVHHPQYGANVAGRVLVMPSGRGSSSSSSVLAETIRAGTAPAAIVLFEPDAILALGAIVASELYGRTIPVVVTPEGPFRTGGLVTIHADTGSVRID
jgi:predicted aconitase with swiveling domain